MSVFTLRRKPTAAPPAEIIPAPRTLDEQIDDLSAELVDLAYARRTRDLTIHCLSLVDREVWPTSSVLRSHLALVCSEEW